MFRRNLILPDSKRIYASATASVLTFETSLQQGVSSLCGMSNIQNDAPLTQKLARQQSINRHEFVQLQ
jgi:hypothetical protein